MEDGKPAKALVKFDDFAKLDLRVGRVVEAREHANADKLLILKVDCGSGVRQVCAPLKHHYRPEELVGKEVVVLVNLESRNMRGEVSEGMVLVANEGPDRTRVVVLSPAGEVGLGSVVS